MYHETIIYENNCLNKANKFLKDNLSILCKSYKILLQKYIGTLFKNSGRKIPNIEWTFEYSDIINRHTLRGNYDNNIIYVIPQEDGSFKVSIEVKTIIELDDNESEYISNSDNKNQELMPPPLENFTENNTVVLNNVACESYVDIVNRCIEDAKTSGASEMYINSGGEILYPFMSKENVKAHLSDHYMSEDEFDDAVDSILDFYKGVEVNEDTNVVCFHFGGDSFE